MSTFPDQAYNVAFAGQTCEFETRISSECPLCYKLSETIATCSTRPHGHSARSLQWTPQCTQLRGLSYTVDFSGQTCDFEASLLSERSLCHELSQTIVAFSRRPHCHSPRSLQCTVDGGPTEVNLILLISRVKRARLRPAF